jgi:hypothetical protein
LSALLQAGYETGVSVNWPKYRKNFKGSARLLYLQVGIAATQENIYGTRHATAFVEGLTPLSPRPVGDTIDVPRQAQT